MAEYLAHRTENGRTQTLLEHLLGTAALAALFASVFGAKEWGYLSGLCHDLGKYSAAFQKRLLADGAKVDHATAGSRELMQLGALPAAFCVAGHHGGLPDGGNRYDAAQEPTLLGRQKRELQNYSAWQQEITLPPVPAAKTKSLLEETFFTRMLYSCLVDADFLDTEKFFNNGTVLRGGGDTIPQLLAKLQTHLDKNGFLRPQTDLNKKRAQVLTACLQGAGQAPGLFSLTVPTGGGKTIASLAFALQHAATHGMQRVIYVIPYCSIIDQTVQVFQKILGKEQVLAHHSGADYEVGDDGCLTEQGSRMALASENWDAPVVVTTAVQFFESIYASKPSQCRKLHNIANSVVIFDEAQMIPIPCLTPCVSAIAEFAQRYRVSAVLCTATQPALDGLFAALAPGLQRRELCPEPAALYAALRRTTFRHAGRLEDAALAQQLQAHRQVLCIVNSRKQAQDVFDLLADEGKIHLSTLQYPAHRARLIAEIRRRLDAGEPCRVVSTSLIEAGVDVDFPAVYRAEAGLDSILQAAGRCNREGRKPANESVVTVFQSEQPAPRILGSNIAVLHEVLPLYPDFGTPEAIHAYFSSLLALKGGQALDIYGVLPAFENGLDGNLCPFRTVSKKFKMINTTAKTVYVPFEEGRTLLAQLQAGHADRDLFRRLGHYGVTVYPEHYAALLRAGDIALLEGDTAVLVNEALYSAQTGLSLAAEEAKALWA